MTVELTPQIADVIEASGEVFTLGAVEAVRAPVLELVPLHQNYRGFVPRMSVVTQEDLRGVDVSYLSALAEQQRRVGAKA